MLTHNNRTFPPQQPVPNDHIVPVFTNSKNEDRMRQLLPQGVPFVMNNIEIRGKYDPYYFINKYHGHCCRVHYIKWKMPPLDSFFILLVIYTHQKLGRSSRFALSYCLLIPSFHFPAGLAYGKAFPDRVLGTLRCIYGCRSFLGYHYSQWCSQSSGTLSNKRSSSGPGFAILLIW